ncbi:MAG: DUF4091 domain-containing protein [Candidatus Hydrogenedentes bacterium]|nr:DUF4091 domain-containing protein [Candidatus Hydrogenedentota bacterium]
MKFAGTIKSYEVVATGTVNGEVAADALVALGDAALLEVPAQRSAKVWISVDSRGAEAGAYRGRIRVRPLHGEAPDVELPLAVDVAALRMPHPFPIALCTWDYVPNRWFPSHTAEVLDDMSRHGVNIFPRTELIPGAAVDAQGRLEFDWEKTEKGLELLKGRGQVLFQIGHPPIKSAEPPSPDKQREFEIAYLRAWRDHLKELGWDYSDYALYPVDEPGLGFGPTVPVLIDAAQLFREADPLFRIYTDPVPTLSRRDFDRIENLIDVWCPNMRFVTGLVAQDPRIARIRSSGKTLWSYDCVSQVKSLSPLRYNRANAWRADFFGLTGIGVWTHSTTEVNHWFAGKGTNDEYALVYPGELPVPSVRWEALRDGLEDVVAMHVLAKAIADARGKGTDADFVKEAEEELRVARLDIMELSGAAFVESRDYLKAGDRRIPHTWTDIEIFARHRENIAELTLRLTDPIHYNCQ